jgi:hypothetical protein
MALSDWLFGSGALKKAANVGDNNAKSSGPSQPAGLDMVRLAQESADRQKAQAAPAKPAGSGSPLSSPMTPVSAKKAK